MNAINLNTGENSNGVVGALPKLRDSLRNKKYGVPYTTPLGFIIAPKEKGKFQRFYFILDDGKTLAYPTVLILNDRTRVNLEKDNADLDSSLLTDDISVPPTPRSYKFFEGNTDYDESMLDKVAGIAAYKVVNSPEVMQGIQQSVSDVV